MRLKGFFAEDRNGLRYLEGFLNMKIPLLSIRTFTSVIIHTVCYIGVLLDLGDHIAFADGMNGARLDKQHVSTLHFHFI